MFPARAGMNRHDGYAELGVAMVFPARAGMNRCASDSVHASDVFPARAGMNRLRCASTASRLGVPRTRGDEPACRRCRLSDVAVFPARAGMNRRSAPTASAAATCSPHARG